MQIRTLKRVCQNKVYEIRGDGYHQIRNAGIGVLQSLLDLGLVRQRKDSYHFELTDAGKVILREIEDESNQISVLRTCRCGKGKVRKWYSYRMSGRDTIESTGKNTIDALVRKGLVYLDYKPKQIGDFNPSDNYVLTDAGKKSLEEIRIGRK